MTAQPEDSLGSPPSAPGGPLSPGQWLPGRRRLLLLAALGVLLALLLYYPVGAWRANVIDDDANFAGPTTAAAQSKAVALAAALIRREIDVHGWTPNKPFFMPAAILDDMPNFQKGIIAGIGRFALEMDAQVGRAPGWEGGDADLSRAAGLLQYPSNVWMVDPRVPWATTVSTEKQYRNGARAFEAYNQRLAGGTAVFLRRPEVLQAVLQHFAEDLEQTAASLDGPVDDAWGWFAWHADEPYYAAKGRAYASLLLLKALGDDFAPVLAERNLADAWQAMLAALSAAALPRPWVVLAGGPTATFVPNHPAILGFHLLRAHGRMIALADSLQ